MKSKQIIFALLFTLFITQAAFSAGLYRSTRINFNAGMMENMTAAVTTTPYGSVTTSYDGSGAVATLGFGTHITEGLWGNFRLGFHALEATNQVAWYGEINHTVGLAPIMVGFRNYLLSEYESGFQPYISVNAGPIIGVEATQKVGLVTITESHTETTLGSRLGAGVDFLFTSWFGLELDGGYIFMNDFKEAINGEDNYNGWDASFGITFFLGNQ